MRVSLSTQFLAEIVLLSALTSILAAPWLPILDSRDDQSLGDDDALSPVIVAGWYTAWLKGSFPPSRIPWERYNEVTFAFAVTTDALTLDLVGEEATLQEFVSEAREHGVPALLSIGGWTGSRYFSPAVATPESRTAFVKTIVDIVSEYGLDGVDFDWEYPNAVGMCNERAPEDSANFLAFLQELREDPKGSEMTITAAAHIAPFNGPNGVPLANVADFANLLDHLAIMGYDIHGQWDDVVGANAPLNGGCPASSKGSVAQAVDAWTSAEFPPEKLLLGVAAYGRSFEVDTQNVLQNGAISNFAATFNKDGHPLGEDETPGNTSGTDECGLPKAPAGVFSFNGLIKAGYLGADGKVAIGPDTIYGYDDCTETPFLYKESEKRMISYDDARSWDAKGKFINEKHLAGFAVWHVAGDSPSNVLLNSIYEAMQIESLCNGTGGEVPNNDTDTESEGAAAVTITVAASASGPATVTEEANTSEPSATGTDEAY